MNKIYIFDFDDTLRFNIGDYNAALIRFQDWITNRIGPKCPHVADILKLEQSIDAQTARDLEAAKKPAFAMERFPTSLQTAYKAISDRLGIPYSTEDLNTAYEIGMMAFDEKRYNECGLAEGVVETLDFLVEQKDELILLTKGDKRVQEKKIQITGVNRWFGDEIFIVDRKDVQTLRNIVGISDKSKFYHVGNSLKSDILPALDAGINAIYIPFETWEFEKTYLEVPIHPRLQVFTSIIDIKTLYKIYG